MSLELFIILVILPVLSISIFLAFTRLLRGPSLADRVVALDLVATLGIGVIGAYAMITDQRAFLDVAIVVALLVFLGTVGFAYYIEQRRAS